MAMITVKLLLEKLGSLLAEEIQLIGGVPRGVKDIQEEFDSMKSFLQDADSRSETNQQVKTWVNQVRDVTYDTEDVLDEFLLRLAQPPHGRHGFMNSLTSLFQYIGQLKARHRLAIQIQNIKASLRAISERRNTYGIVAIDEGNRLNSGSEVWHDPRLASLYIDEADVVGISASKDLLIRWLVDGELKLTVISVVGMGGLGKTTLVKKAFDSQAVKRHFDCHAWITVSKSFVTADLLRTALKGFLEATNEPAPEGLNAMSDVRLVEMLRNHLDKKRYVIVFDDVWSINVWEAMRYAFPDCKCGSRMIFTTRIADIAASIETTSHVYNLQPLPEAAAWTLFCMKAFRLEYDCRCPAELEELSLNILKKCSGLPLAIVAIGGLLSKKNKTVSEWKKIHERLGAEMRSDYNLESIGRILLLSYNNLPYHLKSCYLYLSVFPEDYLIKRMKLIRLWVVEGFVEEKQGLTTEEVAEDYLNELVSRSMIEVVEKDVFNRVNTCRVHDLMREIIQSKSREERLVTVVDQQVTGLPENVRRMSIHDTLENIPSHIRLPRLRSLLLFISKGSSPFINSAFFHSFRLLKVLELEGTPLVEFPPELSELIHLRYLSLRRTRIRELPKPLGKLRNLEILDLKGTPISTIPTSLLKLKCLRQLRNFHYRFGSSSVYFADIYGMRMPIGIGSLTNLQKLGIVELNQDSDIVRELGKLTQLRRLGISKLRREQGLDLCTSLEKLKHLTSLYTVSVNTEEFLQLGNLSSPSPFLQHLYLKGRLATLPDWIFPLRNLVKLVLQYSSLDIDPLGALQEMNLVYLELRLAYSGEELCCSTRGYPRLRKLGIFQLDGLKRVRIEGAMPKLRRLEITGCGELETVPLGIEQLHELQELRLWDMPLGFLEKIGSSQAEDGWKVQHIPTIKHVYKSGGRWIVKTFS